MLPDLGIDPAKISQISISACGTAYYAGLVGRYWIERYARIPVEIDIASEFRYREPPLQKGGLALFVSQSGETADTLATLRYCKSQGQRIASIVNVRTSTIARESDVCCRRWPAEIASRPLRRFTLPALRDGVPRHRLGARARRHIGKGRAGTRAGAGRDPAPHLHAASNEEQYEHLAHDLSKAKDVLYLGRRRQLSAGAGGRALKLKEISYIHAEGYAAGELKHGPIALIDENVPVIVVAPNDALFEKTVSNMQEVAARGRTDHPGLGYGGGNGGLRTQVPHRDAAGARLHKSAALFGADPAPRLSHGDLHGHRRGSAAQPRQVRHSGIGRSGGR